MEAISTTFLDGREALSVMLDAMEWVMVVMYAGVLLWGSSL